MRKKEGGGKIIGKRGRARKNDETQRGSGQGWMGVKGGGGGEGGGARGGGGGGGQGGEGGGGGEWVGETGQ